MLTTAPHLYIRRPSPTTAEFTVTTCPPLTLPLRLVLLTIHLARSLLFLAALLTLYARFFFSADGNNTTNPTTFIFSFLPFLPFLPTLPTTTALPTLLHRLLTSRPIQRLTTLANYLPPWAAALLALGTAYLSLFVRLHTTESVLVLRGLGIQTRTAAAGVAGAWGGTQTRFIPTEKIRDVLINEAFRGFEVRYYLVVVVEGEEDVVVLFPGLLPRRRIVEAVWRGVRGCLFEGEEGGKGKGG